MTGCRIGKVKMKGGADILRFPKPERDEVQKSIVEMAVHFANSYSSKEMHGYVMIAWSEQTTISVAHASNESKIGNSMLPAFAEEETRRALLRQGQY